MDKENQELRRIDMNDNPARRQSLCICLDVHNTTSRKFINSVNDGLKTFVNALKLNNFTKYGIELAVFSAGDKDKVIQSFLLANQIKEINKVKADNTEEAIDTFTDANNSIKKELELYKEHNLPSYEPIIIIISDEKSLQHAKNKYKESLKNNKEDATNLAVTIASYGLNSQTAKPFFKDLAKALPKIERCRPGQSFSQTLATLNNAGMGRA